ncbi:MAG: hypothetical protein U0802_00840 [Candidatus Binatia bacterium]
MGLFSRVRRQPAASAAAVDTPSAEEVAAPAPEPEASAHADRTPSRRPRHTRCPLLGTASPRAANAGLATLRDDLQQLYGIRPSRDAFAEEAIKLIARSSAARPRRC